MYREQAVTSFWELRPGAAVTVAERFTGELRERGGDKLMTQDGS